MRSRIISAVLLLLILLPIIGNCTPHEHNGEKEVSFLSGLLSSAKNLTSAPTNSVSAQYVISGMSTQSNWAWCHKCNGLFYYGLEQPNSICPRDGLPHEAIPSGIYLVPYLSNGQPVPSGYQDHWHWCKNCQAIWYDSPGAPNVCPNGGTHDATGSASYALGFNATPNSQQGWRWCNQCGVLHFGLNVSQSMCPATHGNHSTVGSGEYYINIEPDIMTQINQMELALSVETGNGSGGGISAAGQILAQSIYPAPSNPIPYYSNNIGVQEVKIANAPDRGLSYIAYSRGNIIRFGTAPRSQIAPQNFVKTDLPASNITFSTLSSFGFVYFKGNFYLNYVSSSSQGGQYIYKSSDCINWTYVAGYGGAGSLSYSLSAVVTGAGSASEKIWLSYATPVNNYGVTIQTSTDGSTWNSSNYKYDSGHLSSAQLAALSNGETILAFSRGGVGNVALQYVISVNGVFPNYTASVFPNSPISNIYREIDITSTGTIADVFLTYIDPSSTSTAYLKRYNLQNGTQLQSTAYTAPSGGVFQKPSVNLMPRF